MWACFEVCHAKGEMIIALHRFTRVECIVLRGGGVIVLHAPYGSTHRG